MINVLYVWPESGVVRWWLVKEGDGKRELIQTDSLYDEDVKYMTAYEVEGERRLTRGKAFLPLVEKIKSAITCKVHMVRVDQYGLGTEKSELPKIPLEEVAQLLNLFDWTYKRHKDFKAWSDTRHQWVEIRLYLENMTGDELMELEKMLNFKTIKEPLFGKYYGKYFKL